MVCPFPAIGLDPLTDFFPDQAGRPPGHDGDDDGEREDIFIGAGKRKHDGADRLKAGEQEAAQDRAIDAAETADNGGGKSDTPR